jgi:Rrf2 family transcriptional regulator, nitric oxide-sensitive transcriptional repressor
MQNIIRISEAAAIALHAADLLARSAGLRQARDLAAELGVPYNHLAKVLQQLHRAGLVTPERGPRGGFSLSAKGRKARIKDFLRAIDGPFKPHACLMKAKVCRHSACLLGDFLRESNRRFEAVLEQKISEFSKVR